MYNCIKNMLFGVLFINFSAVYSTVYYEYNNAITGLKNSHIKLPTQKTVTPAQILAVEQQIEESEKAGISTGVRFYLQGRYDELREIIIGAIYDIQLKPNQFRPCSDNKKAQALLRDTYNLSEQLYKEKQKAEDLAAAHKFSLKNILIFMNEHRMMVGTITLVATIAGVCTYQYYNTPIEETENS